jgi:hypothetical protein
VLPVEVHVADGAACRRVPLPKHDRTRPVADEICGSLRAPKASETIVEV